MRWPLVAALFICSGLAFAQVSTVPLGPNGGAGGGSGGPPSGAAGGSLAGTYPNPTLAAVNSIGTSLTIGGGSAITSSGAGGALASGAYTATGTSGATLPLLNGTNTFSGTQTFGSVVGSINAQSNTTYTLAATDCGKTVVITNASAITLTTLNSIPAGCAIAVEQGGAGQITVSNGSSATLTSAHSYTKTFNAAGAIIGLFVDTNSGTNAHFVLTGDGA